MTPQFSKILEEYCAGERGLPTYDELIALLGTPSPVRAFQSAEQNEQLARDAQAILDAEMRGIGFLVDGVSVHPSRVTVLRPQVVADERAQNMELVINRLETISQNNTDTPRTLADEALVCARAAFAAAPVQPVAVPDGWASSVKKLVGQLGQYQLCMSYNDSYFTEPAGLVKQTVRQLSKLMDAAPAAQGNAKEPTDKQLIAAFSSIFYADYQGNPDGYELAIGRAAIAAKAAS